MCLIRAVGGGDRTADKCLSQSDAAAADVVGLLMSADCETLASELTLATWSGGLLDPGHGLARGPCLWMVPSRKWIWRVERQILHVPLDLFADWESGHF